MKKLLMSLAALPAATMAVEASAQTYGQPYGQAYGQQGYGQQTNADARLATRIQNLEMRYQAALNARVLTDNERVMIGRRLAGLRALHQRYSYDGRMSETERRQLQQQIRTTRDQIRAAGGTGWANSYGWSDRDLDAYGNGYGNAYGGGTGYTTDQYGRRIPAPGVTYDQYGRPMTNGGYYGQGGPYTPAPSSGSGIGGVLGNVLGGGSGVGGVLGSILGNGGLNVGSVITGVIGNALGGGSNYGYRDRNDVYFRSDGQRVYEIDARTNTVVRVHPVR